MFLRPGKIPIFNNILIIIIALPLFNMDTHAIQEPITTISLNAISGLQYDIVRFTVKPGAKVRVVLTNRDEMAHNMVFTQPGARNEIVNAAMNMRGEGPSKDYIPESANVLWHIPLLVPGESDSVTFTAPRKTGIYPYVCSIIGHGMIMYGAMYVTNGVMPPLKDDENIPEFRKTDETAEIKDDALKMPSGHPYNPEPPFLYRLLLPDVGPAAIAVSLPNKLSYCWDAGTCRLRYAWSGEFLDMIDYWSIKAEEYARILGKVFYRDQTKYPLRVNNPNSIPAVKFKGYNLIKNYPEFLYAIDGIDVTEIIYPKTDGSGLIRTFKIPKTDEVIWFVFGENDGANYDSSVGKFEKGRLKLSPADAREFSITMTRAEGVEF
jgi:azurin